ncbi:hypothetical protein AB0F15_18240 [Amycolatopsis sp. NPDC026612]|uniref:hypothetical protein n=1 Tax=Amycolatopsis sp. NPDC026612 TaxID=3155466 RepID=UPI0033F161F8
MASGPRVVRPATAELRLFHPLLHDPKIPGRRVELIALAPPGYQPSAMTRTGLVESHHAVKWAVSEDVRR